MDAEKIKNIRIKLGLKQKEFAELVGVSKRSIANYESGESSPNSRTLFRLTSLEHKIVEAEYHQKDPMEFIEERKKTHESAILRIENSYKEDNLLNHSNESADENYGKGVPYYDIDFTASFLEIENNQSTKPDSYISHPFFKGCDYVVRASGQSMAKVIAHGDAIGLIRIENWHDFFPLGEIYAIVTNNGFRMIKVITEGETKDTYTLISKPTDNKKDEFPPQQIQKNQILSIFKVQASSHLF